MVEPKNSYTYTNGAAGTNYTQVATGPCILERIVINKSTAWTIGVIDATSGTTPDVLLLAASVAAGSYDYGIQLANGLRLAITGGNGDATIVWRQ